MNDERALEQRILDAIAGWTLGAELDEAAFTALALHVFSYQLATNAPYARYCAARGVTLDKMPASWESVPPVPAAAFKEATLATFDTGPAELAFETSGTTRGTGGRHFMRTARLYDAALIAGFDRFVLAGGATLRYLNLVPNPRERPQSSLGHMMERVSALRGDGHTGWYLRGDSLLAVDFFSDLAAAVSARVPVCIATTAFALAGILDEARERGIRFLLPAGSRIMETGGFKGRRRVVPREELYSRARETFGIDEAAIVAEYGMTELSSQWYDDVRDHPIGHRLKAAPVWLRARAVAPDGATLPDGVVGALAHVDLANLWSCVAVQTEDLGACFGRRIVLLGREADAALRGCSLDAESLQVR